MDLVATYSSESESTSSESESTISESESSLSSSDVMPYVPDFGVHNLSLNDSPSIKVSSVATGGSLISENKEALDRELTPILAQLMTIPPDNDKDHDFVWLYQRLAQPNCSVDEFKYVIGTLQENVCQIMTDLFDDYVYDYGDDGDICYVFKAAAEALAIRCPVLEGPWETVAWRIFGSLGEWKNKEYGPASTRLCTWIIHAVGDPYLCPVPELRIYMLRLYRTLVNINDGNREQAWESLMFASSSLDRRGESVFLTVTTTDVIDLLMLFSNKDDDSYYGYDDDDVNDHDDDYLYQTGQRVAEKLRQYRKKRQDILLDDVSYKYGMGLKKFVEPKEIQSIAALLRYVSDGACIKGSLFRSKSGLLNEASSGLLSLIKIFKVTLQEPDLLEITAKSVMDVMEAVVIWAKDKDANDYDELECLYDVDLLLDEFCDPTDDDCTVDKIPIGMTIIRRYKGRICKMRSLITEESLDFAPRIYDILYNDQ
ncbi:unnamed protein product [Meganyctiphanes norvegica]|uniref:Uncharacterized protein n=1 Tax=Meganyctiphanes norvegica TaxID=48144 RepID=A0AAV2RL30_MEGNR